MYQTNTEQDFNYIALPQSKPLASTLD